MSRMSCGMPLESNVECFCGDVFDGCSNMMLRNGLQSEPDGEPGYGETFGKRPIRKHVPHLSSNLTTSPRMYSRSSLYCDGDSECESDASTCRTAHGNVIPRRSPNRTTAGCSIAYDTRGVMSSPSSSSACSTHRVSCTCSEICAPLSEKTVFSMDMR